MSENKSFQLDLQDHRHFEALEFFARQTVEGFITGLHKSPFHGFSVEFSEHRIYNPGESIRHIDWKLYGRTDRLYTKRFEEETNLRALFMLDTSGSMFYPAEAVSPENPNKALFSAVSILALMNLLRKQRDAVGLATFGQQNRQTELRSNYRHHRAINRALFEVLAQYQRGSQAQIGLVEKLHLTAQSLPRRSLLLLFSDLFEAQDDPQAFFDALKHLKYQRHEILLFWTLDTRTELDFTFENRPYRFVDLETGQNIKLNPREVVNMYREQSGEFAQELRRRCLQYRIELVEANIAHGYQSVLQAYLIKRKRMR